LRGYFVFPERCEVEVEDVNVVRLVGGAAGAGIDAANIVRGKARRPEETLRAMPGLKSSICAPHSAALKRKASCRPADEDRRSRPHAATDGSAHSLRADAPSGTSPRSLAESALPAHE